MKKNIAAIFAGGCGVRMGLKELPKQFLEIEGKPIIIRTLEYFENHDEIDEIYIACIENWIDYLKELIEKFDITKVKKIIPGGKSAMDTQYVLLNEIKKHVEDDSIVLLHDGVRPFITSEVITNNIRCATLNGNAVTSISCNETILVSSDGKKVTSVPIRRETFTGQAPQTFILKDILDAHNTVRKDNPDYNDIVDSCSLYIYLNKDINLVEGNRGNIKVTNPVDVYLLKGLMEYRSDSEIMGIPSDLHKN
ncbi:MAG: 2-C-methyl-D-erythritol 4-phosphate cytidylyltransferase [Firmicutes bacterium]|nr:2-C-methyl-D-erythritol 4-phosphate cytidylyltransferase [Bacillota bacterium]